VRFQQSGFLPDHVPVTPIVSREIARAKGSVFAPSGTILMMSISRARVKPSRRRFFFFSFFYLIVFFSPLFVIFFFFSFSFFFFFCVQRIYAFLFCLFNRGYLFFLFFARS